MGRWTLLMFWPLLAGFWPTFGTDPLQQTFPLEARGNIRFQADAARFRGPEGPELDVAISVPGDSLAGPADSAYLAITVEPLDRRKKSLAQFRTEMHLPPASVARDGGFPVPRSWVRLTPPWLPGTVGVRVRVEDLTRLKRGLYDRIREKHRDGQAAARIVKDGEPEMPVGLSSLLFAWGPDGGATPDSSRPGFRGVRARLEPNPYRYYGLFQRVLTLYWERYPDGVDAPGGVVETRRVLQLPDTLEVAAERETLGVLSEPNWMIRRFDISGLRGGAYRFEVSLRPMEEPGRVLARSTGDFQVVWEERNWWRQEAELREIARVVLPSQEFDRFERMARGEQETYFRDFWNRHAPAEPGEVNPLERQFEERRDYVDRYFPGQRAGMLSDRGRVYIRLGPPDEIRAVLNPQDAELLWLTLPAEMADDGEFDKSERQRLSRRRTMYDNSAYEVWEYTTRGDPLLPEYIKPGQKLGLKFVFVDELGTGDYTLVYSNAPGTLQ